jgi:hypothetical protein
LIQQNQGMKVILFLFLIDIINLNALFHIHKEYVLDVCCHNH